ncbi:MAG: acetolactate decarboxylase [Fibrobacter sp.]|nr:acetolactate decarboxylase [Fibrobacter sp.]
MDKAIYQISTLNALALGYTRKVVSIEDLLAHGDTGLGTFENLDGEMIVLDGHCYRASDNGAVTEPPLTMGVPFASVAVLKGISEFEIGELDSVSALKDFLNLKIEEDFGLNSMHIVRIDGFFAKVDARSENGLRTQHVELKELLGKYQKAFTFENLRGSLVCLYYPDYMEGINAAGWHFHFISEDKTRGGHVFDVALKSGVARLDKISKLEMQLPREAAFDTYSLTKASQKDIKQVEQGKG